MKQINLSVSDTFSPDSHSSKGAPDLLQVVEGGTTAPSCPPLNPPLDTDEVMYTWLLMVVMYICAIDGIDIDNVMYISSVDSTNMDKVVYISAIDCTDIDNVMHISAVDSTDADYVIYICAIDGTDADHVMYFVLSTALI